MKRRRGITPALRDRWIRQWERASKEGHYRPFLRTEDVPSSGNRGRIRGVTSGRTHHLMSFNEQLMLVLLDHDRSTVDVFEQYPLLPVERTVAIAEELGIKHPRYPGSSTNVVLTTDFVTIDSEGKRRAYAVKGERALQKNRTQQKLALERGHWMLEGVEWQVVTDTQLRTTRNRNLLRLQPFGLIEPTLLLLEADWLAALPEALERHPRERTGTVIAHLAKEIGSSFECAIELFYHGLWNGAIKANLDVPLSLALTVEQLGVKTQ